MAQPFDVSVLIERTFGSAIDKIATAWRGYDGFTEDGPNDIKDLVVMGLISQEECRKAAREFAPVLAALREGVVVLVDADRREVPRAVWFSGRWTFYRDEPGRQVEWLEVITETGQKVEYYNPRFVAPAAVTAPQGNTSAVKPRRGQDSYADVGRGLELAQSGLSYSRAAAVLFEELHPKPAERSAENLWVDERRRFIGRMRTKISNANKSERSSS